MMSQPCTDLLVCSGGDGSTLLVESGDVRHGRSQVWCGQQHTANLVSWLMVVEQQRTREASYVVYTLVPCPKDTPQVEFEHTHANCTLGNLQLWEKEALNLELLCNRQDNSPPEDHQRVNSLRQNTPSGWLSTVLARLLAPETTAHLQCHSPAGRGRRSEQKDPPRGIGLSDCHDGGLGRSLSLRLSLLPQMLLLPAGDTGSSAGVRQGQNSL